MRPRPGPRQENRPTQQDTERKTDLWRTSDNVPICFHCGRPGHVTRYCRDIDDVFLAHVIEVIRRTLDAIHNAANQDLHLVAHLFGPVRKTKTCDLRGRLGRNKRKPSSRHGR
ncbi:UNVERIFIED_CONTAM: hypothetical protein NCL1_30302 [Trichonephila clavipes]